MLETIREFGLEQLENSGKIEAVRRQHLDWCVTIARMPESRVLGGELRRWLARLDVEHANIRATLTWAIERAEIESALLLAGNLWPFWFIRSHLREGMDWLQRVRPMLGRGSQAAQSAVLVGSGAIAGRLGDYSVAVADLQEGLARAQMSGDAVSIGIALLLTGHLESEQGNLDVAQSLLNEAVAIFDRHDLPFWRAHTLHLLGRVAFQRGDLGEAAALMTEALDLQRHLGNDWGIAVVLMSLGLLERRRKDSHRAQAYLGESFALNWMIGAQVDSAQTLEQLAAVQAHEGELNRAARWMAAAAALREKIGLKWLAGSQQIYEAEVAFIRSRLGEPKFVAAWTEGQSLPEETAVAEVLDALREAQTHVGTSPGLDTADRGRQRVRE
jgi:non-specific serine/threonine protein kinase